MASLAEESINAQEDQNFATPGDDTRGPTVTIVNTGGANFRADLGENGLSSIDFGAISTSEEPGKMYKVIYPYNSRVEKDFHPLNIRRTPNRIPFLMKMLDSNFRTAGVYITPGFLLTGIKFSPNPTTFSINSSKSINRYNTMTRWVEEHWGDEIDNILFSGSTMSFFGYNLEGIPDVGLTTKYRNQTTSYAMIREMARFFKVNGLIFQDSTTYEDSEREGSATQRFLLDIDENDPASNSPFLEEHPRTGQPLERLYINIFFDYISILGYFESFDIIEDSTDPYRFTYNCVFKSERTKYHQGNAITSV